MPKINEWVIPKNIQKPVETVCELKNEDYKVPSFEEFMKGYQADEKVSVSYVNELSSYGDVRVEKSYGPGNNMSNDEGKRLVKGVAGVGYGVGIAITTAVCPPLGATLIATTAATAGGAKIVGGLSSEDGSTKEVADFIGDTLVISTFVAAGPTGLKNVKDQINKK